MATQGLVLFGHGARDPRWREPFERLAEKLRTLRASDDAAGPVSLAFLELMEPSLPTAVAQLVAQGCEAITVVPVFFGQGGHIRKDLPELIERCREAQPDVRIDCAAAVGEDEAVLDALAQYCQRQAG
jgi:sirohydrochlorin cobaltochelatase